MEAPLPQRSILVGIALVAATTVIGGVIAAIVILSGREHAPEDLLPASATVAVLRDLSAEHLGLLRAALPAAGIPDSLERGVTAALVRLPNGAAEWVRIVRVDDPASGPAYRLEGATGAPAPGDALSRDPAFVRMAARRIDGEPWAFFRLELLDGDVHPLLAAATEGATHAAALRTGGAWRLVRHPAMPESRPAPAEHDLRLSFPDPVLALRLEHASGAARWLDEWMTADGRAVAEGLLRQEMLERTGASSGWLLPLLSADATLEIATTASGSRFLLRGTLEDPSALDELHDRFAARLPRVRAVTLTLDQTTTWTDLRADAGTVAQSREEAEGWIVRTTREAETGLTLATATKEGEVLVGDDATALLTAIRGDGPRLTLRAAGTAGRLRAGGLVRPAALQGLLPPSLPALLLGEIALPWNEAGPFAWKIERDGETASLVLSRPGEPEPEPSPLTGAPGMPR